jgi:hypothetical protein
MIYFFKYLSKYYEEILISERKNSATEYAKIKIKGANNETSFIIWRVR